LVGIADEERRTWQYFGRFLSGRGSQISFSVTHGWWLLEGPTYGWQDVGLELGRFLKPFLDRLGHKARRQMCPFYLSGLIGPGDHKSIQAKAYAA